MELPARAWLDLQCRTIPGVTRGLMMLSEARAPDPKLVGSWPDDGAAPPEALLAAARSALENDRTVLASDSGRDEPARPCCVAVPVSWEGHSGAAALELDTSGALDASVAADLLARGAIWLGATSHREDAPESLRRVLRLICACLEPDSLRASATALATELATQLDCERVSIGLLHGGRMRITAVSHSAHFDERSQLFCDLEAAMEEAADQDSTLVHPPPPDAQMRILRAQEQLAEGHGVRHVCTVPLERAGRVIGACTLERSTAAPFTSEDVDFCEDVSSVVGPVLALAKRAETGALERGRDRLRREFAKLGRPGNPKARIVAGAVVAGIALLLFAPWDYRVKGEATLEGRVQRAIVARFDGYIAEATARAGDVVEKGQTLGHLDDRDLRVEQQKWQAKREQLRVEYFEALAAHDRTRVNIIDAKRAQAGAQLALLTEELGRTRLVAPFDGVVVKGDLSQSLGSPVSKGDVLFEIAPLEGYRVIVKIDERDVSDVADHARGELQLSAMPGESLPFTLERVSPAATAEDGRNFFRAEARLEHPPESLRPGLEGVARIDAGRRRLAWIYTHDLLDWLRLGLWSWWP